MVSCLDKVARVSTVMLICSCERESGDWDYSGGNRQIGSNLSEGEQIPAPWGLNVLTVYALCL